MEGCAGEYPSALQYEESQGKLKARGRGTSQEGIRKQRREIGGEVAKQPPSLGHRIDGESQEIILFLLSLSCGFNCWGIVLQIHVDNRFSNQKVNLQAIPTSPKYQ